MHSPRVGTTAMHYEIVDCKLQWGGGYIHKGILPSPARSSKGKELRTEWAMMRTHFQYWALPAQKLRDGTCVQWDLIWGYIDVLISRLPVDLEFLLRTSKLRSPDNSYLILASIRAPKWKDSRYDDDHASDYQEYSIEGDKWKFWIRRKKRFHLIEFCTNLVDWQKQCTVKE